MVKNISLLGSTGSIGVSTLDVVARHPDQYNVVALTANSQVDKMVAQCQQFHPAFAVMACEQAAQQLNDALKSAGLNDIEVLSGEAGLVRVAAGAGSLCGGVFSPQDRLSPVCQSSGFRLGS